MPDIDMNLLFFNTSEGDENVRHTMICPVMLNGRHTTTGISFCQCFVFVGILPALMLHWTKLLALTTILEHPIFSVVRFLQCFWHGYNGKTKDRLKLYNWRKGVRYHQFHQQSRMYHLYLQILKGIFTERAKQRLALVCLRPVGRHGTQD